MGSLGVLILTEKQSEIESDIYSDIERESPDNKNEGQINEIIITRKML